MLISGQCRCGNISLNLEWLPDPSRIPAWAWACLKEMGFIETKPGAAGDDEYVLIVDPIGAAERLIEAHREEIPEAMINALREKSIAFGK